MQALEGNFPNEELSFIKTDTMAYTKAFFPGDDDIDVSSLRMEPLTKEPFYDNFLFVPVRQKAASTLTEPTLKEWGIDIKEKASIILNPCCKDEHGQHCPFIRITEIYCHITHM